MATRYFEVSIINRYFHVSELHAVVNNAGIMTIGDYEWQTQSIIENTINVNLLGAMRVASAFLPELRRNAIDVSN